MAITNRRIWEQVETKVLDYFAREAGSKINETCFAGELPPQAYNVWMFEINGGDEPLDALFVSDFPGNCGRWRMSAMVMGRFTERADAQYLAGIIRTLVPLKDNAFEGLKWLRPVSEPTLSRVTIDDGHGGEINCWEMEYPLEVIMIEQGAT